ncbi:MAG: hypothetical protein AAF753_11925, partial [Pseudomonadota bacterium]
MRVFVLNSGRCGSLGFARACTHISNFTSAHESRSKDVGPSHFDFPDNHIEVDNRLSWFLGSLDRVFGDDCVYVHLTRNAEDVAKSHARRFEKTNAIMWSYMNVIYPGHKPELQSGELTPMDFARDYVGTVNDNITLFLKDKTRWASVDIEAPEPGFRTMWDMIGAEGDFDAALAEFSARHHRTVKPRRKWWLFKALGRGLANPRSIT